MTVKDIKLKYCVGVLPMNMVFANVKEDNTQRIYDAADNKGSEELVSEKTGGKPSAYSILCGGDSIKKNLTPEENVSNEVKKIIREAAKVKNEGSSLIVKKDNILKATGALLTELKNEVKGKCTLTEIEIENQFLYFLSDITMGHFVANKEGKLKEIISRDFRNILKNKKLFDVVVNDGEVTIKSLKNGNIMNGFIPDTGDIKNQNIDEEKGISPKKEDSQVNPLEEKPGLAMDNSNDKKEVNNLGETSSEKLDNDKSRKKEGNGFSNSSDIYGETITPEINNPGYANSSAYSISPETASYDRSNPYGSKNNSEMNNSLGETI